MKPSCSLTTPWTMARPRPEPRRVLGGLLGEERLEHLTKLVRLDAATVVRHGQHRVAARRNNLVARAWLDDVDPRAPHDDLAAPGDRVDRVANQVVGGPRQLRVRAANDQRRRGEVRAQVDARPDLLDEPKLAVGQARLDHAVDVEVLLDRPSLAPEREQVLDGLGGAERGHLDELDVGTNVANRLFVPLDLAELAEDHLGQRDERAEGVVEIVRDPARQHAQGLHPLGGGQPLLDAALVPHAGLHQLLAQANALQGGRDLVAKRRVGVDAVRVAERDDAEQLVLEGERQDQEVSRRSSVSAPGGNSWWAGYSTPSPSTSSLSRRHIAERKTPRSGPATQAR